MEKNLANPVVKAINNIDVSIVSELLNVNPVEAHDIKEQFSLLITKLSNESDDYITYNWRDFLREAEIMGYNDLNENSLRGILNLKNVDNSITKEYALSIKGTIYSILKDGISNKEIPKEQMDMLKTLVKEFEKISENNDEKEHFYILPVPGQKYHDSYNALKDTVAKYYQMLLRTQHKDKSEELIDKLSYDEYIQFNNLMFEIKNYGDEMPYKNKKSVVLK